MEKSFPWEKCSRCHQLPLNDDLVKSVYYSIGRFANNPPASDAYRNQLDLISKDIENGIEISYDDSEIRRLENEINRVATTKVNVALLLFKIATPGIVMALIAIMIILIRKCA